MKSKADIQAWLTAQIASELDIPPEAIDPGAPFESYGLSSRDAVTLSGDLEDLLDRSLSPTIVYNYPSVAALAAHLAGEAESSAHSASSNGAIEDAIAIIGIGCRFPGASSPQEFWELLCGGRDAIRETPPDRWDADALYDPKPGTPGKTCTRFGGYLDGVDQFDAAFFGISPREATAMDPQQRILLETAWAALEDAGIPATKLAGSRTGVFVGISSSDYSQFQFGGGPLSVYTSTGSAFSIAANRLSYLLDLHGPSVALDTACSASLAAVHQACQSLRYGDADCALAAGVNLILTPDITIAFSEAGMLAPDGRCKTFDASANGYVRSEGCGVVVLKRLRDALADGDPIAAIIRGAAVNHDGRTNGLTAPNGAAQQSVMRDALARAGVDASDVEYIEAHGTGTSLGDPIEMESIQRVYAEGRAPGKPCLVGSVKTNIGHLESAAGMAGLIKTVLAMQHELIPAHLHFKDINPLIALGAGLAVSSEAAAWPKSEKPRRAGVSAFGFGGSNAHVIIEEAPETTVKEVLPARPSEVLLLSAKTEPALNALARVYARYFKQHPDISARDVCHTVAAGRTHHERRAALLLAPGEDMAALAQRLEALACGETDARTMARTDAHSRHIAFLFTGQGAQYAGMGRQLYETEPRFRQIIAQCEEILRPHRTLLLRDVLFGACPDPSIISQTAWAQPALFALEYALAQCGLAWGVQPVAALGHSLGEYLAACVAGAFSLEDGLRLVAERARLMDALPREGGMAVVYASEDAAAELLAPHGADMSIAGVNAPDLTVISGRSDALEAVLQEAKVRAIRTKSLDVSHAFHSRCIEPMLDAFESFAQRVAYHPLTMPLASNVDGTLLPPGTVLDAAYWRRHARAAVRFQAGIESLAASGIDTYLEIGPTPALLPMGRRCLPENTASWLPSLKQGRGDWESLLPSLAALYVQGAPVDWAAFEQARPGRRMALPTYPFQRQRYWIADGQARTAARQATPPPKAALDVDGLLYELQWKQTGASAGNGAFLTEAPWLIFADASGVAEAFAAQARAAGGRCVVAYPGAAFTYQGERAELASASPMQYRQLLDKALGDAAACAVLYAWGLDAHSEGFAHHTAAEGLVYLLQALLTRPIVTDARLMIVTRGAQAVADSLESPALAQSLLWGLGRVVMQEHPEFGPVLVDLDPMSAPPEVEALWRESMNAPGARQAAWRGAVRYEARLARKQTSNAPMPPMRIRPDASYLITGGLGGLGLEAARGLAEQGARHIILLGRTPLPPREAWNALEPNSRDGLRVAAVRSIEALGATVYTASVDVSELEALRAWHAGFLQAPAPPIAGVLHGAGILDDKLLLHLDAASLASVIKPKAAGAWALHQLFQGQPLDFFIVYSSAASLLGSPGQGNYAAANAWLDAFVQWRRAQGLHALAMNWGPWSEVGMAVETGMNAQLERRGVTGLPPQEAMAALWRALEADWTHVCVFRADWEKLAHASHALADSGFLDSLLSAPVLEEEGPSPQAIRTAAPMERIALLRGYIRVQLARVLGMAGSAIPDEQNVLELGLDSIMVMEIVRTLEHDLRFRVHPREVFERPVVAELAAYLSEELERAEGRGGASSGAIDSESLARWVRGGGTPDEAPPRRLPGAAFLLSSPRSGSTLMRVMLAGHPGLFCPPELHLLPFATMSERQEALGLSYLGEGLQRALMELDGRALASAEALVSEQVAAEQPTWEMYRLLLEAAAPKLLLDKSPSYAVEQGTLLRAEMWFEGARYIHLARHPYAVIESFVRNRFDKLIGAGGVDPYALAEEVWVRSNRNLLEFGRSVGKERCLLVKYEELVSAPEIVMRRVCGFLDILFDPAVLEPYNGKRMTDGVKESSLGIGDPNFLARSRIEGGLGEAWRRIHLPNPLGEAARQIAVELGYELPAEADARVHPTETEVFEEGRI